ncbi:DMT family transporter [Devosia sp. Naph2]|uniref:DMT family transporter n=1 Tax=Devosia polycyclovorans TaxID=3345148 RepID=UPI0035CF34A4
MMLAISLALSSGFLVGINRQVNGTLALHTSPLRASFVNHLVGFALLTLVALVLGEYRQLSAFVAPWQAYLGGALGVLFVAGSSWLILRLGAVRTTLLLISGQMLSGVALDILQSVPGSPWARLVGVVLILAGMFLSRGRLQSRPNVHPRK